MYAATVSRSFAEAGALMDRLAETPVPAKQVERLTRRVGSERVAERAAAVADFQALPLAQKFQRPAAVPPPALAVVMVDGGRLQILDPPAAATDDGAAATTVAAAGPAVAAESWGEEAVTTGHWREDKVGLLLTMTSEVATADPCPNLPPAFRQVTRIPKLVRELHRHVKQAEDAAVEATDLAAEEAAWHEATTYEPPAVAHRHVVASRQRWPEFAPILAQAAWAAGFQQAERKAFVADGAANNWEVQRRFFGSFEPILDFIHALAYVYAAAQAGRRFADGWRCYQPWIGWVWQGQVAQVIAALQQRQAELGPPEAGEAETSPRSVVQRSLTYLTNHQDKMPYDRYRRQGLPITSSLMESVVKQVGRRVKGTEKFWSEAGAEAILQLRADHLSDEGVIEAFWQRRQQTATGQRRYRSAG